MPEFLHPDGTPVYPRPKPKNPRKRWGYIIGAALLVTSVAGCSAAFWTSDKSPAREDTVKAQAAERTATPKKELAAATTLSQWFTSMEPVYTKLENDLDAMSQAPSSDACATLLDDIHAVQETPIPDDNAELANYWNRGMSYYEIAFAECKDGDYTSSSVDLDKGTEQLTKANDLIGSLYL